MNSGVQEIEQELTLAIQSESSLSNFSSCLTAVRSLTVPSSCSDNTWEIGGQEDQEDQEVEEIRRSRRSGGREDQEI